MIVIRGIEAALDNVDAKKLYETLVRTKLPLREFSKLGHDHLLYGFLNEAGLLVAGKPGVTGKEAILAEPALLAGWYTNGGLHGFFYKQNEEGNLAHPEPGDGTIPTIVSTVPLIEKPFLNAKLQDILGITCKDKNLGWALGTARTLDSALVAENVRRYSLK